METKRTLDDKVKSLENELVLMRYGLLHVLTQLNDTLRELEQWQRWQVDKQNIDEMRQIRDELVDTFNDSEFRDLCLDMAVDYDTLGGDGLDDKARELILHHQRRKQLDKLIDHCKRLRPSATWPNLL